MALDNTIIATAIPKITDQFHSLPDVGVSGDFFNLLLEEKVVRLQTMSASLHQMSAMEGYQDISLPSTPYTHSEPNMILKHKTSISCHQYLNSNISIVVRKCISPHHRLIPAPLRKVLHLLLDQMGLPRRHRYLRTGQLDLRCCP